MNLDTSDYYPKSHLDDEETPRREDETAVSGVVASEPMPETEHTVAAMPEACADSVTVSCDVPETPLEKAITGISHFLSWILVPMFMPVYGIIFCFTLTILAFTGFGTRLAFTVITATFNVVVPAIIIILLKKLGFIQDVGLNNRQERFIPYIVSIVCLIGTAIFMHFKGAPWFLVLFFLGGAAAGIVEAVINRWWKISVHAAGIAGVVALLLHLLHLQYTFPHTLTWFMITVGAAGLLGAARIWLGRHTLWQVMAGYAVGFCAVYFIMMC